MGLLNVNGVLSNAGLEPRRLARAEIQFADRDVLAQLFTDPGLTNMLPNALIADENGIFDLCYLIDDAYHIKIYTSNGQLLLKTTDYLVRSLDSQGYLNSYPEFDALKDDATLSYSAQRGTIQASVNDFVKVLNGDRIYRVAPSDANDSHVTSRGGVRFYVNTNKFELEAADFGVRLTGDAADAANNRAGLQTAIDFLDAGGQGGRIHLGNEGDCVVDLPPLLMDRIELDLGGGILRNTRTAANYQNFLSTQALQVGKMHPRHMDILPWRRLLGVGFGDDAITVQTAGDAAGFVAGDMVLIADAAAGMGAGKVLPDWAQWNRVHSVSGSLIRLERPMEQEIGAGGGTLGSSAAGAWIANVAARTRNDKNWQSTDLNSWIDGAPFMAYRPRVVNGTMMTQHGGVMQGVGMFEGLWDELRVHPGEAADGRGYGGLFSNAFAHSRLRNVISSSFERAIEVKCLSQHTIIEDFEVYALNHPHGVSEAQVSQIALGENSRDVIFRNGLINLGKLRDGSVDSGFNLINFTPAVDSGFDGVKFVSATRWARLAYGPAKSRGCYVRNCDFDVEARVCVETEMPDFAFCSNIVRRFTPDSDRYLIRLQGDTARGQINDNDFRTEGPVKILAATGAANTGTEICRNRGISTVDDVSGGRRAILRDNRNVRSDALLFSGVKTEQRNITVSATSQAAIGAPVVIPAGTVESGDYFAWTITGALAGSGTKTLSWRAALDSDQDGAAVDSGDDTNIAATVSFPATCNDFEMRVSATIHGSSTIITAVVALDLTNNNVLPGGDIGQHNGAALATRALRMELSGFKAEAGATMIVRTIRRDAARMGYLI